ncbi:MAG TPA: hypothetical protein VJ755_02005 [Gemmatimonadales bacterium]|nr:hypothetical protein [Gemmatimonadales bacterium]
MRHLPRFLVIAAVLVALAAVGFYILARHIRSALVDRPHIATISVQLRALVSGQMAYRSENRSYTTDVLRVWRAPADSTARGVRLRIISADADGFIAEGRSDYWDGRCAVATGRYTGDSLTTGIPVCRPP